MMLLKATAGALVLALTFLPLSTPALADTFEGGEVGSLALGERKTVGRERIVPGDFVDTWSVSLTAEASDVSVSITNFQLPSVNYEIRDLAGNISGFGSGSSFTVTDLPAGDYLFYVAGNVTGDLGSYSAIVAAGTVSR